MAAIDDIKTGMKFAAGNIALRRQAVAPFPLTIDEMEKALHHPDTYALIQRFRASQTLSAAFVQSFMGTISVSTPVVNVTVQLISDRKFFAPALPSDYTDIWHSLNGPDEVCRRLTKWVVEAVRVELTSQRLVGAIDHICDRCNTPAQLKRTMPGVFDLLPTFGEGAAGGYVAGRSALKKAAVVLTGRVPGSRIPPEIDLRRLEALAPELLHAAAQASMLPTFSARQGGNNPLYRSWVRLEKSSADLFTEAPIKKRR